MSIIRTALICLLLSQLTPLADAAKLEFGFGLATNIPIDKPLPELTNGFGYLVSAGLMFKYPLTVTLGATGTRHDLDGGEFQGRQVRVESRRNLVFLQLNYRFLKLRNTEFSANLGLTSDNIHGGDSSGSYLEQGFETDQIGYSGNGQWIGFNINHHIQSYYYVIFGLRYNFLTYSKHQVLNFEEETSIAANSIVAYLGVSFRVDLSRF